jgi:hypothetical protein
VECVVGGLRFRRRHSRWYSRFRRYSHSPRWAGSFLPLRIAVVTSASVVPRCAQRSRACRVNTTGLGCPLIVAPSAGSPSAIVFPRSRWREQHQRLWTALAYPPQHAPFEGSSPTTITSLLLWFQNDDDRSWNSTSKCPAAGCLALSQYLPGLAPNIEKCPSFPVVLDAIKALRRRTRRSRPHIREWVLLGTEVNCPYRNR